MATDKPEQMATEHMTEEVNGVHDEDEVGLPAPIPERRNSNVLRR